MVAFLGDDNLCAVSVFGICAHNDAGDAGHGRGGADTVFSGKARGMDALLARVTVVLAILCAIITMVIAKMTS